MEAQSVEAQRDLIAMCTRPMGWLALWGGFGLFLAVGEILSGSREIGVGNLFIGLPLAWATGYASKRSAALGAALTIVLYVIGGAVGYFSPGS